MSKYSEEFERQFKTIGKVKKETEMLKKQKKEEEEKYWIHREPEWGKGIKLKIK